VKPLLTIEHLRVRIGAKRIITDFSLMMRHGELHVLMGPNGSGKSTVSQALLGHPHYTITTSKLVFDGTDLKKLTTDERARLGIFLGFQYPLSIPGISLSTVLPQVIKGMHTAADKEHLTLAETIAAEERERQVQLRLDLEDTMQRLGMDPAMLYRGLNDGFSGGEKKKAEILQMTALKPKLAILDEPDSGLDVDALKKIAQAINRAHRSGMAILLITHYQRILKYLKPDKVHIVSKGTIVKTGSAKLAYMIERNGYDSFLKRNAN
jgi:Fe-S cluster assembly ATP-binding protein